MTTEELLPCPFCGESELSFVAMTSFHTDETTKWRRVKCGTCGTQAPETVWNHRLPPPPGVEGRGDVKINGATEKSAGSIPKAYVSGLDALSESSLDGMTKPDDTAPPTDALVEALPEKEYLLSVIRNYHENGHECDECPPDHAEDKCPLWERAKSAGRSMTPTTHTESDKDKT